MKTLKLILGILCLALCLIVLLQSCAAGMSNAWEKNGEMSGSAGFFVALGLLIGGVVMVVTHKMEGRGGSIACVVIFPLVALLGFVYAGSYSDLKIWSGLCVAMAAVNLVSVFRREKQDSYDKKEESETQDKGEDRNDT